MAASFESACREVHVGMNTISIVLALVTFGFIKLVLASPLFMEVPVQSPESKRYVYTCMCKRGIDFIIYRGVIFIS